MSENGCEFCRKPYKSIDSGKGGKEKSILYMGGNSPYVQLSRQYLHYMDVAGRMDLFEVKFCPICGRDVEGMWRESRGCNMEYGFAKAKGIPIKFIGGGD